MFSIKFKRLLMTSWGYYMGLWISSWTVTAIIIILTLKYLFFVSIFIRAGLEYNFVAFEYCIWDEEKQIIRSWFEVCLPSCKAWWTMWRWKFRADRAKKKWGNNNQRFRLCVVHIRRADGRFIPVHVARLRRRTVTWYFITIQLNDDASHFDLAHRH